MYGIEERLDRGGHFEHEARDGVENNKPDESIGDELVARFVHVDALLESSLKLNNHKHVEREINQHKDQIGCEVCERVQDVYQTRPCLKIRLVHVVVVAVERDRIESVRVLDNIEFTHLIAKRFDERDEHADHERDESVRAGRCVGQETNGPRVLVLADQCDSIRGEAHVGETSHETHHAREKLPEHDPHVLDRDKMPNGGAVDARVCLTLVQPCERVQNKHEKVEQRAQADVFVVFRLNITLRVGDGNGRNHEDICAHAE